MDNSRFLNTLYLMRLSKRQFELAILFMWFTSLNARRKANVNLTFRLIKHYLGIGSTQIKQTLEELSGLNILSRIENKKNGNKTNDTSDKNISVNTNGYKYIFNTNFEDYIISDYAKKHLNAFSLNTLTFVNKVDREIKSTAKNDSIILVTKFIELYAGLYDDAVYVPVWGRDVAHMKRLLICFQKNGYKVDDIIEYFNWLNSKEGLKILKRRQITAISTGILRSIASEYLVRRRKMDKFNTNVLEDENGHKYQKRND